MRRNSSTKRTAPRTFLQRGSITALTISLALSFGTIGLRAAPSSALVDGATSFAFDLYGQLKTTPGNLFFSPYSISTCLAMTYAGARGETEKQMAEVLHFSGGAKQVHTGYGDLQRQLVRTASGQGLELCVANALWAQRGHPFLPAFLNVAQTDYQAKVNQANFNTDSVAVTQEINHWVAQKTKDKIKDILSPGSVDRQTCLVLANAIYFYGRWEMTFQPKQTTKQPFQVDPSTLVDTPLMHHTGKMRYLENDTFQAVELPYRGNQFVMLILLPRTVDGCGRLESQLSGTVLTQSLKQMSMREVDLFVPKFQTSSRFELQRPLEAMGMANAFGPGADFSGMDGAKDLFISAVIHQAWVDVTETGTEAAAATATVATRSSIMRPIDPPIVFRADHPFIYLIRDTQSGCVLFLGRLANPIKPE